MQDIILLSPLFVSVFYARNILIYFVFRRHVYKVYVLYFMNEDFGSVCIKFSKALSG